MRVLTANEAAAVAADLCRVQAVGCYPITPQTVIVERLADLSVGRDDREFANLESEHSIFGYVLAAARAGVRTFTATSSQGLLYAHEQLQRASRERVPLVAVNVNRAIFAPWSIEPDLSDSMAQRDAGWIQLYCANAQEVLDTVVCAYRIAEVALLPVMVCAEGFLLSHTSEAVEVPTQEEVDEFLPRFAPPADWVLDPDEHRSFSALPEMREYVHFQRSVAEALEGAVFLVEQIADEFTRQFDRRKVGALEVSGNPEASRALVAVGTIGETALELLEDDDDLLVVRVHAYRPLPAARLRETLAHASRIAVVDRAPAFGALGPLGADIRGLGLDATDVVCGLGGDEVTPDTLRWILEQSPELGAVWR